MPALSSGRTRAPAFEPISRARAEALNAPILIALSGGGDSVALLRALVQHFGASLLRSCIVDHALRDGSDAEARTACEYAHELGVAARIVTLFGPFGAAPGHQRLRAARLTALCDEARAFGARCVALAHTADDQAETVWMRAARGSEWRGLAGMRTFAPAPLWPAGRGLWFWRPLLHTRRADLRAWLRDEGAAWLDDPSNDNRRFARVRARQRLGELEREGFAPARLCDLAANMTARADALDAAARDWISLNVGFAGDRITAPASDWPKAETALRVWAALIAAASGGNDAPGEAEVESARGAIAEGVAALTLGGALVRVQDKGAQLVFSRDSGAVLGRADGAAGLLPLPLPKGVETIWDGRLAITAAQAGWSVSPGPDVRPVFRNADEETATPPGSYRWLGPQHAAHFLGDADAFT